VRKTIFDGRRPWVVLLELSVGPLVATVAFGPPLAAGLVSLAPAAWRGGLSPGGCLLTALVLAALAGTATLWIAVLRARSLRAAPRALRLGMTAGLGLGLVAMAVFGGGLLLRCGTTSACLRWGALVGGPTLVALRHGLLLLSPVSGEAREA